MRTKTKMIRLLLSVVLAVMMLAVTSCGELDEPAGETANEQAAGGDAAVEEEAAAESAEEMADESADSEKTDAAEADSGIAQQDDTDGKEQSVSDAEDLSDRPNADDGTGEVKILEEGDIAPDFTVNLSGGDTFKLSDHDDKTVIINFWATWCGPCVNEMPAFEMLKNDEIEGLEIVCINCMEDQDTVDQFVNENGYTFHIGYDEDGRVLSYYPTDGIPYTLVVKKGRIASIFVGAMDAETQYREYKNAIGE